MSLNPHQKNKVDVSTLSPEEQRLFRLYGKLPSRSDHFAKHLKERKYFDSGDYAMSKAGKGDGVDTGTVGSQHPVPEMIPHLSPPASAPGSNGHNHNGNAVAAGVGGATLGVPTTNAHHLQAGSPVKESSFLNRETTASDLETVESHPVAAQHVPSPMAPVQADAIPIRR